MRRPKTTEGRHREAIDGPRQLWRPGTPPFYRTWVSSPREALTAGDQKTCEGDISRFERKNHAALELSDYSKRELLGLIAAQGLDPPGRLIWDPVSATMVREVLPKETYVDFCRQKFYENDPQPVVRVRPGAPQEKSNEEWRRRGRPSNEDASLASTERRRTESAGAVHSSLR